MGSHYPPFGALLTELTEHLANSVHWQELCTLGAIISRIELLSKYPHRPAKDGRVAQDKYNSKPERPTLAKTKVQKSFYQGVFSHSQLEGSRVNSVVLAY